MLIYQKTLQEILKLQLKYRGNVVNEIKERPLTNFSTK